MSLLLVLGIAAGAAALSFLTEDRRRFGIPVGLLGLAIVAVAGLALDASPVTLAGVTLAPGPFARLVLVLGASSGLALSVIGLAAGWSGALPAATLATLTGLGLALSATDPLLAVGAAAAAGLPGIAVALRRPAAGQAVLDAGRHARAVVVGAALALVAAAVVGRAAGEPAPAALAAAYLGLAAAIAIRLGAVPFHIPAAGLARSAPTAALPLLLAWAPAGLAAVALTWIDGLVSPLALPLGAERSLVVAVGSLSLIFGAAAAWMAEDVERTVGYLTLQAGGYAILGVAALDPAAWQPARAWLLAFVLVSSALAGWAVAVRAAFGTGRIEALDGWARRAPLLAVAFGLIVVAAVGWPGSPVFEARLTLARLAADGPLQVVLVVAGLASIATYGRLILTGFARPGPAVEGGTDERFRRPRWPESLPAGAPARVRLVASAALETWRLDRVLIAAVLALILASGGVVAAAGGLGVREAAVAAAPLAVPPGTGEEPSFGPVTVEP